MSTKKRIQLLITFALIGALCIPLAHAARQNHTTLNELQQRDPFRRKNIKPTQTVQRKKVESRAVQRYRKKQAQKFYIKKGNLKKYKKRAGQQRPIFDFPVAYNARVRYWVTYFQTNGRKWFKRWLERSTKYIPLIQTLLRDENLPLDLAYVAMVESGFSNRAESHAQAVGMWQFIKGTGNRYGLRTNWWLDERKDFLKSTRAAIRYKKDLYKMFRSWHLVSASYNTGENRIKRLIKKYNTNDFWRLADMGVIPDETKNYVPKIIAATLIAKSPGLYGFRNLNYELPLKYEYMYIPGGTNLQELARFIGVRSKYLKELNPELIKSYIPKGIRQHRVRIPRGSASMVSQFIKQKRIAQKL